ncbi:uncharacterized protein EI90DRAFT_2892951, partial [Cantharellus anzutake]|uniref:uncharacterized protein n=1 Tax=Cantharellus anzutake TaxID=1750568 RepID=UPI001904B375
RYSILPVMGIGGYLACEVFEGPITGERFIGFLREHVPIMWPYPGPWSVLLLGNCSIHHSNEVRLLIEVEA